MHVTFGDFKHHWKKVVGSDCLSGWVMFELRLCNPWFSLDEWDLWLKP